MLSIFSFTKFHRNTIAAASLFLAAKVEEQPRKLEHVIKVNLIQNPNEYVIILPKYNRLY